MAILNFKKRFAGKILNGQKRQTIRAFRKYPISPGEKLYLYTGLRTKHSKKLREVVCKDVQLIKIVFNSRKEEVVLRRKSDSGKIKQWTINGQFLDLFAKDDGFKDWFDMREFWRENHPGESIFGGTLIEW